MILDPNERISIDHALNHPFINPDSPQYLEKISLSPLLNAASKTCFNITKESQNVSMRPSFSILGGQLGPSLLAAGNIQPACLYLNIKDGRIYDEESIMKAHFNEAQALQESNDRECRKRSSELRAGQYFGKSDFPSNVPGCIDLFRANEESKINDD